MSEFQFRVASNIDFDTLEVGVLPYAPNLEALRQDAAAGKL